MQRTRLTVAVLGAGKMGKWFARFFLSEGFRVVVADRKQEKLDNLKLELPVETAGFAEAAASADWVLLCTSIEALESVAKNIGDVIRPEQVVMDIASIKEGPVKIMHAYIKKGIVLGMHPVFGPGSKRVKNKVFILTPVDSKEEVFASELSAWLTKRGAKVFVMSPKRHDELMSVVLGFTHFIGLVTCDALLETPEFLETKRVAGTSYRLLYTLAEAPALEDPSFYAQLQLTLPKANELEQLFVQKAKEWLKEISKKDMEGLTTRMQRLREKLTAVNPSSVDSYEAMYRMLEATENS
jgi:prephenate dehydrogenase